MILDFAPTRDFVAAFRTPDGDIETVQLDGVCILVEDSCSKSISQIRGVALRDGEFVTVHQIRGYLGIYRIGESIQ